MDIIAHRINTIEELKKIGCHMGIEVDLRDYCNKIILQHDPFIDGESFEDFLFFFNHNTLILNIKSEGIEYKVKELLGKYNIVNYFFLDSSFPMINKLTLSGETKIALRLSEYEGIDTIINMCEKIEWVWVDCFTHFPLTSTIYNLLNKLGLKICLVSPELQGNPIQISEIKQYLIENMITPDAICTKPYNDTIWKI